MSQEFHGHRATRSVVLMAAVAAAGIMAGCTMGAAPRTMSVSGTATYRERIALPPGAVFEARLVDVSRADAPAELVASYRAESPGAPPFPFTLAYDPAHILPQHRYAIEARVSSGDELLFVSDTHVPLPVEPGAALPGIIMVRAAARPPAGAPASGPAAGPSWLRGEYRYIADSGTFTACPAGEALPVAQALDNAALEAAYLKARTTPGAPLLATLVGRVEIRAAQEGPARPTLMVEHFISISAATCSDPARVALEDTYWRLVQLHGTPVSLAAGQRAPYLVLASAGHRASGFAGCNRMTGDYTLDGARLAFGHMASTMMACAEGMELEQAFHGALAKVTSWRLEGDRLVLLDAGTREVVLLESP